MLSTSFEKIIKGNFDEFVKLVKTHRYDRYVFVNLPYSEYHQCRQTPAVPCQG